MARRGYPPEFRRRVVDLVEGGRRVAEVAVELQISERTICTWRRQARIDAGIEAGLTTSEKAELTAAKRRIRQLETELGSLRGLKDEMSGFAGTSDPNRRVRGWCGRVALAGSIGCATSTMSRRSEPGRTTRGVATPPFPALASPTPTTSGPRQPPQAPDSRRGFVTLS